MKVRRRIVPFAVVAGALVLAACGSSTADEASPAVQKPTSGAESDTGSSTTQAAPAAESASSSESASAPATEPAVSEPSAAQPADPNVPDLPDRGENPGLTDIDGWINSDTVTSLDDLKGQVVAVQFWTFGCRNCKATLPHVKELEAKYGDQDFTIVGVHSPEFDYEADLDNIEEAIDELGITWPVVLDTKKRNFHGWQEGKRSFWPRIYLLDRNGHIRYDHVGEGGYEEIDAAVGALLAES